MKDIGVASGRRQAEGAGPERLRHAAEGRRRPLHRLRRPAREHPARGRRRLLAGPRRRRRSRGSAASLGGLGRRGGDRLARGRGRRGPDRRLQLRLREGDDPAPGGAHRRADRGPSRLLGLLPARLEDPLGRERRRDLLPPAGDPRDHGRADRRDHPGRPFRAGGRGGPRRERRHARPGVRAPLLPDPRPDARGVPRGARPRTRGRGSTGSRSSRSSRASRRRATTS